MNGPSRIGAAGSGILVAIFLLAGPALAAPGTNAAGAPPHDMLSHSAFDQLLHVLLLRDYNTRIVVVGTILLGAAAGVIGTFAYLRKRALMGDALSHATLPGIAAAFIIAGSKHLAVLLTGAAVTGVLGVMGVIAIRRFTRLKEDAAIGIVLSVSFGVGMVLFSVVQQMATGNEAGLATFIYGKAAAMVTRDAWLIGGTALVVILCALLLFKEFRAVCFDQQYAAAQGWPVVRIDLLMMGLVVLTTVMGLQAVGLILVVALLIIPAAAARFWTDSLARMTLLAGLIGAASGWLGSTVSAMAPRMPTGAMIVICAGVLFFVSMLAAPRRGILAAVLRRWRLNRKIGHQNLLRALAECAEQTGEAVSIDGLLHMRSWSPLRLRRLLRGAEARQLVTRDARGRYRLTAAGGIESRRILRNHRLWEMYLIKYADIAPSHVDRDADEVEHVLPEAVIAELEAALVAEARVPPSPHLVEAGG